MLATFIVFLVVSLVLMTILRWAVLQPPSLGTLVTDLVYATLSAVALTVVVWL